MKVERNEIIRRCIVGRCPNCGSFGMFRNWFRLNKSCTGCGMVLEKEDSGFYFGTTSIGYVLSIICVIIPVCVLVVRDLVSMWFGVILGIVGSILLCVLLYPLLLSWIIMAYYAVCPGELPNNEEPK